MEAALQLKVGRGRNEGFKDPTKRKETRSSTYIVKPIEIGQVGTRSTCCNLIDAPPEPTVDHRDPAERIE